jgi:hypothetical protein
MRYFSDVVIDANGRVLAGTSLVVKLNGGVANIYSDSAGQNATNPVLSNGNGVIGFYYQQSGIYTFWVKNVQVGAVDLQNVTSTGAETLSNKTLSSGTAITAGSIDNVTIGGTTPPGAAFQRISNAPSATNTTKTISGTSTLSNHWLYGSTRWAGSVSAGTAGIDSQITPNAIIFTDNVDASAATQTISGMVVLHAANATTLSTGAQATRNALQARMAVSGQYGNSGYTAFVAQQSIGWASSNQGGPGGWPGGATSETAYYRGELFGGDDFAWLAPGATNWHTVIGREIEAQIQTGANAFARIDLLLIDKVNGKQADNDDVMLAMLAGNTGGTAPGFKTGISFGLSWGEFPIATGGTLIAVKARDYPTPTTPNTVAYGIDFREGVFSSAAIATPGFGVDPEGGITGKSITVTNPSVPTTASSTGTPGQLAWDSSFIYVCIASNTWKRAALSSW